MSFLSKISLANRSLVALATIAILIVGAFIIPSLKQELYPSLEFPAVTVMSYYQGASPSIVEQDVTDPLEQSIQGMQDIQSVTSYSNQNESIIIVEYNFGVDLNQKSQDLTQQISGVQANLPSGVTPQVRTFNLSDLPVIQLAVTSNENQSDLAADLKAKVVPTLSGINGVAQVNITGVQSPIVSITIDPGKMTRAGISLQTLEAALTGNNLSMSVGQVTSNGRTSTINVSSQYASLDDLRNLVIGMVPNPTCAANKTAASRSAPTCTPAQVPVHLKDIANVQKTVATSTSLTRTNGVPSLGISITKTSDGNTVDVSHAINNDITSLENQLGHGAKITVISDQAPSITSAVSGLAREGLIGAAFAILVILLFLFSLRSTLVTAISIPLSIVIALIALWIGGLSLNLFTLGAMTIAVGRVVDDSIVVLENIYRHLSYGEEKNVAIPAAVREVAGAVTASTLTTVAVFLPIAFVGGLVGEVFGPFAITVTVALLASLFVALTIIPVLAYWFLKAPKVKAGAKPVEAPHEKQTFLERGYIPMINWVTTHRAISLIMAIVIFVGSILLVPHLGTNFFSSSNANTYTITQTLKVGTSQDVTDQAAQQVENVLQSMTPTIQHYQVTIGSSGPFAALQGAAGGWNSASYTITTDPNADQAAFQNDLQQRLNELHNVGTLQFSASSGGGFNSSSIAEQIQAPDQATLEKVTQEVVNAFHKVSNITNITSSLTGAAPLIDVQVNQQEAAKYGLSAATIGQTLASYYAPIPVTNNLTHATMTVNFNGQTMDVEIQLGMKPPQTVDGLRNAIVAMSAGQPVTLGKIAKVTQTLGPTQITHVAGQRTATVSATSTTNNTGQVNMDLTKQINALHLPAGVTVSTGGVGQEQAQAFSNLEMAMLIAIMLVFLVMVGTFRSLVQPLILLVSIPFAATGSLILMLATHTELGLPSMIGLLMLIGIVVTNAIVLLDLINQYRKQGMDARSAVIEGGRHRLRPILMTAIATILALMPMALGLSKDSGFIAAPLAITVIGGLASSTVLTLLLVPTLYVMIEGRKDRKYLAQRERELKEFEERETRKQEVMLKG